MLTPEEEDALLNRRPDPAAVKALVSAHTGLVVSIAKRFSRAALLFEDLVQEGMIGLLIAIKRWAPRHGARLATYARYWIDAVIMEAVVRNHGLIRIGTTRAQRRVFYRSGNAIKALLNRGETPTHEAIAQELGVPVSAVTTVLGAHKALELDAPTAEDRNSRTQQDRFIAPQATAEDVLVEESAAKRKRKLVRNALRTLKPSYRYVIRERYFGEKQATFAALADKLGVSRARVDQIEKAGRRKIQAHIRRRIQKEKK